MGFDVIGEAVHAVRTGVIAFVVAFVSVMVVLALGQWWNGVR